MAATAVAMYKVVLVVTGRMLLVLEVPLGKGVVVP
jgi:hypothetical protein